MMLSFFKKILSILSGRAVPETAKSRLLRPIAKSLRRNKYGKFYKAKQRRVEPAFAQFFFTIYKVVFPVQLLLQNARKSTQLKYAVVETFLEKNNIEIQNRLQIESIRELAKQMPPEELVRQLKADMATLLYAFDSGTIRAIDQCYSLIIAFIQFVNFDYFFFLKRFDPALREQNPGRQPKFQSIPGDYASGTIKDFLDVAYHLEPDQDWQTALEAIKTYRGNIDVVVFDQWYSLLLQIRDVKRSGVLELMVQHIDGNPGWQTAAAFPDERITAAYLETLKTDVEETIEGIIKNQRNARINELAASVFGNVNTNRLKHYTMQKSEFYVEKNFEGFTHVMALNYLEAFLQDYFTKNIQELCELLLIRGQWTSQELSRQLSTGFHEIISILDELVIFDDRLSPSGTNGSRLETVTEKAERNISLARNLRLILASINEDAEFIAKKAVEALITIGFIFKNILETFQKNPYGLIVNRDELETFSEIPIPKWIGDVYKKIYNFIQLLQLLIPGEEGNEELESSEQEMELS